ncbi:MAG: hypothetical protein RL609_313 [Bacteroidota bacterium]
MLKLNLYISLLLVMQSCLNEKSCDNGLYFLDTYALPNAKMSMGLPHDIIVSKINDPEFALYKSGKIEIYNLMLDSVIANYLIPFPLKNVKHINFIDSANYCICNDQYFSFCIEKKHGLIRLDSIVDGVYFLANQPVIFIPEEKKIIVQVVDNREMQNRKYPMQFNFLWEFDIEKKKWRDLQLNYPEIYQDGSMLSHMTNLSYSQGLLVVSMDINELVWLYDFKKEKWSSVLVKAKSEKLSNSSGQKLDKLKRIEYKAFNDQHAEIYGKAFLEENLQGIYRCYLERLPIQYSDSTFSARKDKQLKILYTPFDNSKKTLEYTLAGGRYFMRKNFWYSKNQIYHAKYQKEKSGDCYYLDVITFKR